MHLLSKYIIVFIIIIFPNYSFAQMSRADRNELFNRVEQICANANTSISRYIKFEGNAGAKGIVKLIGADISGSITIEQYENLEQKLNDFRTNPTICRFEAFNMLSDFFSRNTISIHPICAVNPENETVVRSWRTEGELNNINYRVVRKCHEDGYQYDELEANYDGMMGWILIEVIEVYN